MLKEKKLSEETQERAIAQAQLNASVRVRPRARPPPPAASAPRVPHPGRRTPAR